MPAANFARAGFLPARVVHLHPSRFCNLACKHCYSASGPNVRGELAPDAIISTLALLKREGYEVLSFSGGEPLLYSGFATVAESAAQLGFKINLITNGAPLGGRLLDIVAQRVNLVAVSLDGAPETHNRLRGDQRAFAHVERALERLASLDVKYGISFCISRESLVDMPWAVEYAHSRGCGLVQFHPFAATGRGKQFAATLGLDEPDKSRAFVIAALLGAAGGPAIQLDLASVDAARERRGDYAILTLENAESTPLSDLINPLVVDETGLVVPLCYGVSPQFALGRLGPDFADSVERYKTTSWSDLAVLLNQAFDRLGAQGEQFVDWFFHIVQVSHKPNLREGNAFTLTQGARSVASASYSGRQNVDTKRASMEAE